MKSISKILMTFVGIALAMSLQAQSNTGLTPFAGSTHDYHVDQSSLTNTTLTWSVVGGGDYEFVGNVFTGEDVSVKWNTANTYTLIVEEKRGDLDITLAGCPTTRTISVVVSGNSFDIFAELVSDATACATVVNPVVDVTPVGGSGLGDNSDDTFGLTTRVYKVKMTNGDANKTWKFNYALNDIAGVYDIDVVNVVVTGQASLSGSTVNMAIGSTEATITLTYNTNKNTAVSAVNGQDPDFSLGLTIDQGFDELGTPDSNLTPASNIATYIVKAVPATTGITTN